MQTEIAYNKFEKFKITHIKSVIKKMIIKITMILSLIYKLPPSLITETVSEEYRLKIYLN